MCSKKGEEYRQRWQRELFLSSFLSLCEHVGQIPVSVVMNHCSKPSDPSRALGTTKHGVSAFNELKEERGSCRNERSAVSPKHFQQNKLSVQVWYWLFELFAYSFLCHTHTVSEFDPSLSPFWMLLCMLLEWIHANSQVRKGRTKQFDVYSHA